MSIWECFSGFLPKSAPVWTTPTAEVAVIGGGFMGRGIAACLAHGGCRVRIYDKVDTDAAIKGVGELLTFLQEKMPLPSGQGPVLPARTIADAVGSAEFVFEAVFEDMAVKKAAFAEIAAAAPASAVLCSNTSSLSIKAIAEGVPAGAQCPRSQVLAAHFIGPAHLVPLVEVCPAVTTANGLIDKLSALLTKCAKRPVVLKREIDGFVAARLQAALYRECMHLVLEGVATQRAVDDVVVYGFGRRLNQIGPFAVADFAGVDLVQNTHGRFFPQLGAYQNDPLSTKLASAGHCGAKSGKGHIDWSPEELKLTMQRRDEELVRRLCQDRER